MNAKIHALGAGTVWQYISLRDGSPKDGRRGYLENRIPRVTKDNLVIQDRCTHTMSMVAVMYGNQTDKVCLIGRPHHFQTRTAFRNQIEWIRSAMKLAGRTPRV